MLSKGQQVKVIIDGVFPFGVFCHLISDGSLGYIRRRELSLSGQTDPRQFLKIGDELVVVVINLPADGRMLELSWRRAQPDPWNAFYHNTRVGDVLTGFVKYVHPDRVSVEILPGVDGVILLDDLSPIPVQRPEEVVWPGDRVEVRVMRLDLQTKQLQLSIRHHLARKLLIDQFLTKVNPFERANLDQTTELPEARLPLNFKGRLLVAEDDPAVRQALVDWLEGEGCLVDSCTNGRQAVEIFETQTYSVLISDIDMPELDGISLVRALRPKYPHTSYCFISDPDHITRYSTEIDALNGYAFAKPFDIEEIRQFLEGLAESKPPRVAISDLNQKNLQLFNTTVLCMRSAQPLEARLELALSHLLAETGAEKAILFNYDPVSRLVTILSQSGILSVNDNLLNHLVASPVEDVITEDIVIWENRISTLRHEKFSKLQKVISFEACIGIPVRVGEEHHHALFIFHRQPDTFSRYRVRDVQTCAALISVALEEDLFRTQVEVSSTMLLNGQLSSAFNHEVYNKVFVLHLQLDLLNRAYHELLDAFPKLRDSNQVEKMNATLNKVTIAVSDLNRMAEDFRQILRGGSGKPLDLTQAVQHACDQVRPAADRSSVSIILEMDNSLPMIHLNQFALIYVVYNLLLNAIQHLEKRSGERKVGIWLGLTTLDSARFISVKVKDSGPGIHRQLWEKIFELGYTTRQEGSGLGLYIARSLLQTLGGRIYVEDSLIEIGTTFRIDFPEEVAA